MHSLTHLQIKPSMAMSLPFFFFFFFFFFCVSSSSSSSSFSLPVLSPITKDHQTNQYSLSLCLKTPLIPSKLLLDLGGSFSWVDCHKHYVSSTYHHIPCNSSLCTLLSLNSCAHCYRAPSPTCANDTCATTLHNSVTGKSIFHSALVDAAALPTTDGRNPGRLALLANFAFACSTTDLLKGLAKGVTGSAGLGWSDLSLPVQFIAGLSLPRVFALCLSGSPSAPGVGFYGSAGPYHFLPEIDLSKKLVYTPLLVNPYGTALDSNHGRPSDEYFIGVTALKVNGNAVDLNPALLTVDLNGNGGTKISTVAPYTVLESSIYEALTHAFIAESAGLNLTVHYPVKPFRVCFPADDVMETTVGPAVPTVDLVMQSDDVFWRIFGRNSMVRILEEGVDVWCLGFVDGGVRPRTSIVIGGHQMEDNLLQFDLGLKRLGFSSSVLVHHTMCANFNFTSNKNLK
ncbi:probable aspartic proteinase GIP1 [Vitis riparia]|uniref:probable aspartic proteinase GIP1 n=1 Tax=Vitis riparia TaxID=96939 RepID=UPI00155B2127|nr:probable aspartic proteinase GIP1 [Vitis riparia]